MTDVHAGHVEVWTMRVDTLDEAGVAGWLPLLDQTERARARRFVFARHRVQFVAAHALARTVLGRLAGISAAALCFVAGENGKPVAATQGSHIAVSFNVSHTEGMVGLAAIGERGRDLGFDLEPIDRAVSLSIADRYFRPEEIAWLASLPEPRRTAGFLRLWTLKEAFIKATGKGLAQDLASFWFDPIPPRIRFTPSLREQPEDWSFEQRIVDGSFVAAVGMRLTGSGPAAINWAKCEPSDL